MSREIQVTAGGGGGSPSSPRARRCVPSALFPLRVPRGRVEARERAVSPSLRPRGVSPVGEPRRNSLTLTRRAISRPDRPDTNSAARVSDGDDVNCCELAAGFCLHVVAAEGTASPRGDRPVLVRTPREVNHPEPVARRCGPVARRGRGGCRRRGSFELGVCEHGYAFGGGGTRRVGWGDARVAGRGGERRGRNGCATRRGRDGVTE